MFESYEESWPDDVTQAEAVRELRRHGSEPEEFLEDLGERSSYTKEEVLGWLGY